jgi:hypothetical protein
MSEVADMPISDLIITHCINVLKYYIVPHMYNYPFNLIKNIF